MTSSAWTSSDASTPSRGKRLGQMRRIWLVVFEVQVRKARSESISAGVGGHRDRPASNAGRRLQRAGDIEIDGAEDQWD